MRINLPVVALLLLTLASCGTGYEYNITINNSTRTQIDDASVAIGRYKFVAGIMDPGIDAGELMVDVPIPEHARARVEWRTPDGVQHVKEVPLEPTVPTGFKRGVIIFDITEAGEVNVTLGKSPVPKGTVIWPTSAPMK